MAKPKILFFTPTLNRTGSEIVLSNLLKESSTIFDCRIVSRTKGELSKELNIPIDFTYLLKSNGHLRWVKAINKIYRLISSSQKTFLKIHNQFKPTIWYINTITMPEVVACAVKNKIPFIIHTHEMEQMLSQLTTSEIENLKSAKIIIANSKASGAAIQKFNINKKTEICYPGIELHKIKSSSASSDAIREKLNISNETFVWLMSGTIDDNKNTLLFIDLLQLLVNRNLKVHFIWIGSASDTNYFAQCKGKIHQLQLQDFITFTGKLTNDYYDYFNSCNGFVLTSRKESFSLVTVEALALHKPVVCFDCGGTKEILTNDTGIIIPNYDINKMADAMIEVMDGNFNSSTADLITQRYEQLKQLLQWQTIMKNNIN